MDALTIALIAVAVYAAGLTLVVSLCVAAGRADRATENTERAVIIEAHQGLAELEAYANAASSV